MKRILPLVFTAATALLLAGCVERTIKINTQPSGAVVILNDEEVGRTPADVRFTWYGDYSIIVRKEGYETLTTHRKIDPPVYQWPVIDIFTELLIPAKWHDIRTWNYELQPQQVPTRDEIVERATEFRRQAQNIPSTQPAATEPETPGPTSPTTLDQKTDEQ